MLFFKKEEKKDMINRNKLIKEIDYVLVNSPFRDRLLNRFREMLNLFSTQELEVIKNYIFTLDKQVIMNYLIEKQSEYENLIFNLNKIRNERKLNNSKIKEKNDDNKNKIEAINLIANFS